MPSERRRSPTRRNLEVARAVQAARRRGQATPGTAPGGPGGEDDPEAFAFAAQHKEPLTDARHVRHAIAYFDQVEGVSDPERDEAWRRILSAAERFGVPVTKTDWRELYAGSHVAKRRG